MPAHLVAGIAARFEPAAAAGAVPVAATGHIHQTWLVGDRVVQRLNGRVFPDLGRLVATVVTVCAHLRTRLAARGPGPAELDRRVLTPLLTPGGDPAVVDGAGEVWRAFRRIRGVAPSGAGGPAEAAAVGRALGDLLTLLDDLPPPPEAIPGFKDFAARRDAFEAVVAADPRGRAAAAGPEIEGVRRRHGLVDELAARRVAGDLPARTVHNDAKAANVLVDETTGEALCVVDLDTVASGTVLFDAGDLLRSLLAGPSDGADPAPARAPAPGPGAGARLGAALTGWLEGAGPIVTAGERALLPMAGPLMAYENALRFLADHLGGDTYFAVDRPGRNLQRARRQLAVLEALEGAGALVAEVAG